jgi:hypothetical protein
MSALVETIATDVLTFREVPVVPISEVKSVHSPPLSYPVAIKSDTIKLRRLQHQLKAA